MKVRRKPKLTKELLETAKKLEGAKTVFDPLRVYRLKDPLGDGFLEWTGAQLLETANAFSEMLKADQSGDEARLRQALEALQKLEG